MGLLQHEKRYIIESTFKRLFPRAQLMLRKTFEPARRAARGPQVTTKLYRAVLQRADGQHKQRCHSWKAKNQGPKWPFLCCTASFGTDSSAARGPLVIEKLQASRRGAHRAPSTGQIPPSEERPQEFRTGGSYAPQGPLAPTRELLVVHRSQESSPERMRSAWRALRRPSQLA